MVSFEQGTRVARFIFSYVIICYNWCLLPLLFEVSEAQDVFWIESAFLYLKIFFVFFENCAQLVVSLKISNKYYFFWDRLAEHWECHSTSSRRCWRGGAWHYYHHLKGYEKKETLITISCVSSSLGSMIILFPNSAAWCEKLFPNMKAAFGELLRVHHYFHWDNLFRFHISPQNLVSWISSCNACADSLASHAASHSSFSLS